MKFCFEFKSVSSCSRLDSFAQRVVASLPLCGQADSDVRLFLFCVVLSAHRIKDASPQLRLTCFVKLLEPEVES